jgi:hypothetical protein
VEDWQTQNQIAGSGIHETAARVLRVSIRANADHAKKEEVNSASGAQPGIMMKVIMGEVLERILAESGGSEAINGQFGGAIQAPVIGDGNDRRPASDHIVSGIFLGSHGLTNGKHEHGS